MGRPVNRRWVVAVVVGLALTGCQLNDEARADTVEARLGEAFTLRGAQEAAISGADLRVRFTGVQEDSRCPTQVECFWTGQARITVQVQGAGQTTTAEFNTNPAPGQNRQTVDVGDYTITLQSLDPYPQTPDDSIALEDYTATLLVRKAG